ncbi:MAG: chitobiase/beta-hexosaminidase C-terminal domain-containing protein [Patescibacteria group bacterium]|jgi:lysophospholipase L1-like esterase
MDNFNIIKKVRGGGLNGKVKIFGISKYKILLSLFFIAIFSVLFLSLSVAQAAYRDVIEADSPIYYWPMDEAAGATSLSAVVGGTAINLTGATAGENGQVDGTAVSFNGTSNFGQTASSINLTSYSKVLVETLVYFDNYDASGGLMVWELGSSIATQTTGFYFSSKNGNSPNDKFAPAVKGNVGYNYAQYAQASLQTWHHIVAVFDKSVATDEVNLYVDGILQTAESRPLNLDNTNNFGNSVLYLMSRAGTSLFNGGKMQHLAIYTNLSDTKIFDHAQASGVLHFSGGTVSESSHTANSATLLWTHSLYGTDPITEQLQRSLHGLDTWSDVSGATLSPATDSGLSSDTSYDYRVVYTDATSATVYSNIVTVTTNKIYPPYIANSDKVIVGPYDTAQSGSPANFGVTGGHTNMELLMKAHKYRMRQDGIVNRVRLYTVNKTNLTGFYIRIWRKNGSTYDLVGTSNNIVDSLVAGDFATVDLSSPIIGVLEGDYIGMRIESNGIQNFYAYSPGSAATYYMFDTAISSTSMDWESKTTASGVMPVEIYMQAPQVAFIGDSIISGHYTNYSFLHTTETTNIPSTLERQFSNLTGYTYQNMGIGAQTSTQIAARFTQDMINLHPRVAVIEAGVNDFGSYDPATSKATLLANWTSMLDAAQASDSITTILVVKILPWSNGTNSQMQIRDDWNSAIATLAAGYSKAIVVDTSSYVGQFRPGGDVGNLWDIQAAYDQDGVHFTQAGNGQIAQALAGVLDSTAPATTATPTGGIYNISKTVTLSCDDVSGQGCNKTYYTTDGTDPTTNSSEYVSPLDIFSNTILKFFSVDVVDNQESIKTENYVIDTIAPVTIASPASGTYTSTQTVTLTAVDSNTGVSKTYYTTDSTEPTTSSLVYLSPIEINQTTTLKFFSVDNAGNIENIKTENYIIITSIPFIERINLEDAVLNQTYQSQQNNADLLFYLLPKQKSIKDLYIKLIRNKKKHLNGFTKKNSYPGYLKLLSNIGTVKKAYQKNVNKHINFRISVRYSKTKLNKTNIKEKNLRLFIKDRDNIWRGPYRIYQNKITHTLKFKIRNYLVKPPKNPIPNPLDIKTKNRPFAPSFYFRTLKKIKFVIAEKNALSNLTNLETSDSQDFFFE